MPEGLPQWLTTVSVGIVILTALTVAFAIIYSTWIKTNSDLTEKTKNALAERVDFLEEEATRKDQEYKTEKAVLQTKIEGLEQKAQVLEDVVTGKAAIESLASQFASLEAVVIEIKNAVISSRKTTSR